MTAASERSEALLTGTLARDARLALRGLSDGLILRRPSAGRDPTLGYGEAGVALAHAALATTFPGAGHAKKGRRSLTQAARSLALTPMGPGLFEGIAGVAWVAEILAGTPSEDADADPNVEVDAALDAQLAEASWDGPCDLAHGLVGVGVYALERLHRPVARRLAERVIDHLDALSVVEPRGITWRSLRVSLPPGDAPAGCDLGVAHGVPGVVALLGRALDAGLRRDAARRLLDGALDWVLAQERPQDSPSRFSKRFEPGRPSEPARLAWCYGDAGVAASLLVGARALGEAARTSDAVRIALSAARREPTTSGVVDATLCHGAIGLAHVFHRMYRSTGEAALAEASRAWFERGLAMPAPPRSASWGFLTGASGVALALAAALDDGGLALGWDRALLISSDPPSTI